MTDTLVTSAPSVIVAALRATRHRAPSAVVGSVFDRGYLSNTQHEDDDNTFNVWTRKRDVWALQILAEAHALDVLYDAYKLNESRGTFEAARHFVLDHADPYAHIDAMIHEEFPGAIPDAKLGKFRALAQERLDLKSEIESYKRALQEPITDGHDPRIRDLMVKAAETANAHDYCEVYDIIAGEVGLWDRKELGLKEETYLLHVTATGTFEEVQTAIRAANPTFNVTAY